MERILIVEDNEDMLNYISSKLFWEYEILTAKNGKEALNQLTANQDSLPNLIITDVMMDEMDGMEFINKMNNVLQFTHIPIIIITAKTSNETRFEGLRLGAIDYIPKPFLFDELLLKIKSILALQANYRTKLIQETLSMFDTSVITVKAEHHTQIQTATKKYNLTKRETEIVALIILGISYPKIADQLFISPKTVSKHVQHIFEKLNIQNKYQLLNKLNSIT